MRLAQYTDYSLRALMYVGLREGELSTIRNISDAYDISRSHMMKIVQKLVHEGYLEAVRGREGGLRLARAPETIRLGDVVSTMEPDLGLVECFRTGKQCVIQPACRLASALESALKAFVDQLNRFTLADLIVDGSSTRLVRLLDLESGT